jgi:hypothetical protein
MSSLLLAIGLLLGDVITLKNGGKLEGVIIHDKGDEVVVRLKYATVELDRSEIASIEKKAPPAGAAGPVRLPRWDRIIEVGRTKEWEGKFQQVPALVVEEGPLKNVPYMSFRSGNYEFNLYGDPDAPAGIEFGLYKDLLKNDAAKKKCIETIAELMGDPKDAEVAKSLGLAAVKKDRAGFTFEITPETAPDAFGGWWVSVYDTAAIEKARASQEELDKITATREEMDRLQNEAKEEERKRKDAEAKAKADAKKDAADAKAEERRRQQEQAAAQAAAQGGTSTYENGYYGDEWLAGTLVWRNWNHNGIRPVRPGPRPTPRYYSPGYSRAGGSYRAGPRVGGGRR